MVETRGTVRKRLASATPRNAAVVLPKQPRVAWAPNVGGSKTARRAGLSLEEFNALASKTRNNANSTINQLEKLRNESYERKLKILGNNLNRVIQLRKNVASKKPRTIPIKKLKSAMRKRGTTARTIKTPFGIERTKARTARKPPTKTAIPFSENAKQFLNIIKNRQTLNREEQNKLIAMSKKAGNLNLNNLNANLYAEVERFNLYNRILPANFANKLNANKPVYNFMSAYLAKKFKTTKKINESVRQLMTYILMYCDSKKKLLSNRQLFKDINELRINFKNIEDVYHFVMATFCDMAHDIGKKQANIAKKVGTSETAFPIDKFKGYINNVHWLTNNMKSKLLEFSQKMESTDLNSVLLASFAGGGTGNFSEDGFVSNGLIYQNSKIGNVSYSSTSVSAISNRKNINMAILYDQTSKGSIHEARGVLRALSDDPVRYVICLPTIADKGASFASNPIVTLTRDLNNAIKKLGSNPLTKIAKAINERTNLPELDNIADKYIFNTQYDYFNVKMIHGDDMFFDFQYKGLSDGKVICSMKTRNGGRIESPILSASNLKETDITRAMFKTFADMGMMFYGVPTDGVATTGDRMAGYIYSLFTILKTNNRVSFNNQPGLSPSFIYEITSDNVLVSDNLQLGGTKNLNRMTNKILTGTNIAKFLNKSKAPNVNMPTGPGVIRMRGSINNLLNGVGNSGALANKFTKIVTNAGKTYDLKKLSNENRARLPSMIRSSRNGKNILRLLNSRGALVNNGNRHMNLNSPNRLTIFNKMTQAEKIEAEKFYRMCQKSRAPK